MTWNAVGGKKITHSQKKTDQVTACVKEEAKKRRGERGPKRAGTTTEENMGKLQSNHKGGTMRTWHVRRGGYRGGYIHIYERTPKEDDVNRLKKVARRE